MLPRVASHMPRNPIEADITAPTTKATVRNMPDWPKFRATEPLSRVILADVTNTTIGEWDHDDADRAELPLDVGHRAFLDGIRDVVHLLIAGFCGQDPLHQRVPDTERDHRDDQGATSKSVSVRLRSKAW